MRRRRQRRLGALGVEGSPLLPNPQPTRYAESLPSPTERGVDACSLPALKARSSIGVTEVLLLTDVSFFLSDLHRCGARFEYA